MTLSPENSDLSSDITLDALEIGIKGVAIALAILSVWAMGLGFLLTQVTVEQQPLWMLVVAIAWQTFIYTGLFITAHDAMHGAVIPSNTRINNAIGSCCLVAYGLFSYQTMLTAHRQHHQHPASDLDPDYHNGKFTGAISWYLYFMTRYWSWPRFIAQVSVFHFMHLLVGIPEINLILFWILPSLLSSLQLFYFGTYLPHRQPVGGYWDKFCAQSIYRSTLWSFLTCYHFGYHYEHHRYPHLTWWQLPIAARLRLSSTRSV